MNSTIIVLLIFIVFAMLMIVIDLKSNISDLKDKLKIKTHELDELNADLNDWRND